MLDISITNEKLTIIPASGDKMLPVHFCLCRPIISKTGGMPHLQWSWVRCEEREAG